MILADTIFRLTNPGDTEASVGSTEKIVFNSRRDENEEIYMKQARREYINSLADIIRSHFTQNFPVDLEIIVENLQGQLSYDGDPNEYCGAEASITTEVESPYNFRIVVDNNVHPNRQNFSLVSTMHILPTVAPLL